MERNIFEKQRELNDRLNRYRDEYYNRNAPSVSDEVYDRLFDELKELEQETGIQMANSPTQTVGYPAVSRLEKTRHEIPLLSLDKTIIFITANDKESDMLKGYEVGGADYVTKPFSVTVLCKKVAAVFANLELRTPRHDLFDDGFLKIDFSEQSASLAGESLDFTPKEYRTLFLFVKNPRIILTKRQILEKLWDIDGDFVDEHSTEVLYGLHDFERSKQNLGSNTSLDKLLLFRRTYPRSGKNGNRLAYP